LQDSRVPEEVRESVINHIIYTHQRVSDYNDDFVVKMKRKSYLTPKHYLDFINVYQMLIDEKIKNILTQVTIKFLLYILN
jgi:dynein heavy chain